jgi:hypothetical protein
MTKYEDLLLLAERKVKYLESGYDPNAADKSEVELSTGSGLKRCGRCQKVTYCSKASSAVL